MLLLALARGRSRTRTTRAVDDTAAMATDSTVALATGDGATMISCGSTALVASGVHPQDHHATGPVAPLHRGDVVQRRHRLQ
jgi:hypothetical protein